MAISSTTFSPKELSRRYGVSIEKVHSWIAAGELTAVNIATRRNQRARYRIRQEDIAAFEHARSTAPAPKPQLRRRVPDAPVKQYV